MNQSPIIKYILTQKNMNQKTLAEKASVSESQVTKWKNGDKISKSAQEKLYAIAEANKSHCIQDFHVGVHLGSLDGAYNLETMMQSILCEKESLAISQGADSLPHIKINEDEVIAYNLVCAIENVVTGKFPLINGDKITEIVESESEDGVSYSTMADCEKTSVFYKLIDRTLNNIVWMHVYQDYFISKAVNSLPISARKEIEDEILFIDRNLITLSLLNTLTIHSKFLNIEFSSLKDSKLRKEIKKSALLISDTFLENGIKGHSNLKEISSPLDGEDVLRMISDHKFNKEHVVNNTEFELSVISYLSSISNTLNINK